jgi:hypothetical protein
MCFVAYTTVKNYRGFKKELVAECWGLGADEEVRVGWGNGSQ